MLKTKRIGRYKKPFLDSLNHLPVKNKKPIKIGIVGEIYTVLEPFANLNIEKQLGDLGVEASRIYILLIGFRRIFYLRFLKTKVTKKCWN